MECLHLGEGALGLGWGVGALPPTSKGLWASHNLFRLWFPFLQNEMTKLGDSLTVPEHFPIYTPVPKGKVGFLFVF